MIDKCEICEEPMKEAEGAKVYHMSCLMKLILPLDKRTKSDIIREKEIDKPGRCGVLTPRRKSQDNDTLTNTGF